MESIDVVYLQLFKRYIFEECQRLSVFLHYFIGLILRMRGVLERGRILFRIRNGRWRKAGGDGGIPQVGYCANPLGD